MKTTDFDKTLKNASEKNLWRALKVMKSEDRKKKGRPKQSVPFPRFSAYSGTRKPITTTSAVEIVKFLSGELVEDINVRSNASIKACLVEAVEWMAEISDSEAERKKLRKIAAHVVVIEKREHLISYVLSLATSLKN